MFGPVCLMSVQGTSCESFINHGFCIVSSRYSINRHGGKPQNCHHMMHSLVCITWNMIAWLRQLLRKGMNVQAVLKTM